MSSKSRSVGAREASDSTSTRAEKKSVSRSATSPSPPSPIRIARCSACAWASDGPTSSTSALCELLLRIGQLVAVEDLGNLLDVLCEGAVGTARPVGRRTASHDAAALGSDLLRELERETRLADSGRAEDRHEVRSALFGDALPDPGQDAELTLASDHRNGRGRTLAHRGDGLERQPSAHRRRLPFGLDGRRGEVLDQPARARLRLLSDEDAPDRGGGLETRGGVDDVPGDHRLAAAGASFKADDRLAGVDCDP